MYSIVTAVNINPASQAGNRITFQLVSSIYYLANAIAYIVQPQSPGMPTRTKPISHRDHNSRGRKPDGRVHRHPRHSIRVVIIRCRPCCNNLRRDMQDIARHVVSWMVTARLARGRRGLRRYVRGMGVPAVNRPFSGREERTSNEQSRTRVRLLPPKVAKPCDFH